VNKIVSVSESSLIVISGILVIVGGSLTFDTVSILLTSILSPPSPSGRKEIFTGILNFYGGQAKMVRSF